MRIVIDVTPAVHARGGIGRYTLELTKALLMLDSADEIALFYTDPERRKPAPPLDKLPRKTLSYSSKPWRTMVALSALARIPMDGVCGGPANVFHGTDHLLPSLRGMRSVFTLHDVSFLEYPETHLASNRWFLRLMMPVFVHRADAVIAVSKHTADDIVRRYRVPASKIQTIPLGVDSRFRPIDDAALLAGVRQKYGLPPRFILSVGTIEARKNHLTLLHSYEKMRATTREEIGLVIVGRKGWKAEGFLTALTRSPVRDSVTVAGQVADEDLPAIYNLAEQFVYPSWYEGFGLPPLEAMACGVPVICADNSSLPEVVGDAGLLVGPGDEEGLASAMIRVTAEDGLRSAMVSKGKARATSFSWQITAARTREVYQEVYRRHLTVSKRNG